MNDDVIFYLLLVFATVGIFSLSLRSVYHALKRGGYVDLNLLMVEKEGEPIKFWIAVSARLVAALLSLMIFPVALFVFLLAARIIPL